MRKLFETNRLLALSGLPIRKDPCPNLEADIKELFNAIDVLENISNQPDRLDENFFTNLFKKQKSENDAADNTKAAADKVTAAADNPDAQKKFEKLASYMIKDIQTYIGKLEKYLKGDMKGGTPLHQKSIARVIDQFKKIDLLSTEDDVKTNPEPQGDAEKSLPAEVNNSKDLEKPVEGEVETKDEIAAKEKDSQKSDNSEDTPKVIAGSEKLKLLPNSVQSSADEVTADLPVSEKNKGYAAAFKKYEGKIKRGVEPKSISKFSLAMYSEEAKGIIDTGDKLSKEMIIKTLSTDKFIAMPDSNQGQIISVLVVDGKPYTTSAVKVIGLMVDSEDIPSVFVITENGSLYVAHVSTWKK